jgi:hypothetical protein
MNGKFSDLKSVLVLVLEGRARGQCWHSVTLVAVAG